MVQKISLPTYETLLTEAIRSLAVDSGTATSSSPILTNILNDSTKNWATDVLKDCMVKIIRGAGAGQLAVIASNTPKSLLIAGAWAVALDTTSVYIILAVDPRIEGKLDHPTYGLAAIKAVLETLAGEAAGTFVFNEASALEQTMVTLTITARAKIGAIWLDMVNVTRNTTIRVKHRIDGANYRTFETDAWTTADDDGVLITGFTAYRNVQITLQCDGAGAGNVNVPYAIV